MAAKDARKSADPTVHRITNLRGLRERTGKRVKQMTKQAAAARLQKANTSRRSHRLKTNQPSSSSRRLGAGRGAPGPSDVGRTVYPRS